jgi:hypothetical protein
VDTEEVPRGRWIKFFDDFSKEHLGWITTLELIGPDLGDQEEAVALPLLGISADLKDRENCIEITLGGRSGSQEDAHLTHTINNPETVELKAAEDEGHEALEVKSADGTIALLTFRHMMPEAVERQLPA